MNGQKRKWDWFDRISFFTYFFCCFYSVESIREKMEKKLNFWPAQQWWTNVSHTRHWRLTEIRQTEISSSFIFTYGSGLFVISCPDKKNTHRCASFIHETNLFALVSFLCIQIPTTQKCCQLSLYCSFFSFISNSYSLVLPGISLALMSFGVDHHAMRGRSFAFRPWRADNKTL